MYIPSSRTDTFLIVRPAADVTRRDDPDTGGDHVTWGAGYPVALQGRMTSLPALVTTSTVSVLDAMGGAVGHGKQRIPSVEVWTFGYAHGLME